MFTTLNILFFVILIASLVAFGFLLVSSFKRSVWWGLAVLLLPFAVLVYGIKYWQEVKKPFLAYVGCNGLTLVMAGYLFLQMGGMQAFQMAQKINDGTMTKQDAAQVMAGAMNGVEKMKPGSKEELLTQMRNDPKMSKKDVKQFEQMFAEIDAAAAGEPPPSSGSGQQVTTQKEAAPTQEAPPVEKTKEALAAKQSGEASPVEQPEDALPAEQSKETLAVKQTGEALPVKQTKGASPVEQSKEAVAVKQSEEAPPVEQPEESLAVEQSAPEATPPDSKKALGMTLPDYVESPIKAAPADSYVKKTSGPLTLAEASHYVGDTVTVTTREDISRRVILTDVLPDGLRFQRRMSGGSLSFELRRKEIKNLVLE
jgi:hypothetical protein